MSEEVFVSVVMPLRNEEAFIARSLRAVLDQTYPPELLEVIIADGQSSDRTLEVIKSLPGAERVRVISNPRRIQSAGLNMAIRQARGDIIVRVDGHTIIEPDYVLQCVIALQETGACTVGGSMNPVGVTLMGKAIACALKTRFAVPGAFHVSAKGQYTDTVYLGAWPRRVIERLGGFDERLAINEDYELNYRIRSIGGQIYLSPAICSQYVGRQTLRAVVRQYFNYGRGKTSTFKKHPASLRLRQVVAPAFVVALLGGLPLSALTPVAAWFWFAMLLAYLTANLAFSIIAARRVAYRLLWRVPLVFSAIHLAWGLGFWTGLLFDSVRTAHRHAVSSHLALSEDA